MPPLPCCIRVILLKSKRVKHCLLLIALAALLAGCDSQKKADQEAERQRLQSQLAAAEQDRTRLLAEREAEATKRVEAERAAAVAERAALAAQGKQQEAAQKDLENQIEKMKAETARLAEQRSRMKASDAAAQQQAEDQLADQRAAIDALRAKAEEERRKLDKARERAEAERVAAQNAIVEANAREASAKRAQELALKQTTAVFFAPLSTAGDWFDTERYGYVWRPSIAFNDHTWRPYADGRWQYTDYGWTWQSNEPFGWAVYHYGRWARLAGTGWVWVPGYEWAPAWVAWRWHRPREFIGWAPLPPEAQNPKGFTSKVDAEYDIGPGSYAFIAIADFDAPSYLGKFAPAERNKDILPLTSNITYIAPKAGGGMVCGGPDLGLINSELRRLRNDLELKAVSRVGVQLMDSAATTAAPDIMNAGALMLFAPRLKNSPPIGKPEHLKGRLEAKNADRGWDPTSPWQTDEWRGRLKAEAATADAAEKAAANRPPPPPPKAATPTPTPTPAPIQRPPAPPQRNNPRGGPLDSRPIEPSSPLFPRKN